ncbi:protein CHROMATIN REMODELING 20 [Prunus yedoensis var. nudiflora]|uniref:Protein CHROMATIN REMODELING 20 n=1 Tax=Prunus yedoensis var. nudiflora TaxID=2094558 RepID=A0A314ZP30_PRUYE|nr:protein CHROMATIN REMODELING 20 [Prunus yedoensis var. nudiflora]
MDLTFLKPFSLCFAALLLLLLSPLSSANPINSDYNTLVYNQCANQTFTAPPTQQTLSSLFQELIAHSSQSKFFKHTQATGDVDETGISGLFQCIQDISNEECQSCVSTLPDLSNTLCRESVSARVQLHGCYMHYMLDGFDSESSNHKLMHKTCGELSNGLAGGFEEMRDAAFAALESGIVMNGDGFYKTSYEAVQVMAQCVGGLGGCECGECVSSAVQIAEAECGAALSGQIYLEECFLSYTYHPDEIPDHPHPATCLPPILVMEESHEQVEESHEQVEDIDSASNGSDSDSFIDDSEVDEVSTSRQDGKLHPEEPLSDKEIEELIAEFLEVESKAAEAQEALEKESLAKVESEVREELAQTLHEDDLETAVADEMTILMEEWQAELDDLETESAHLLEQLDGAGIELPSLYKCIESQAPNGCCTEAWKRRIHWVGSQVTGEFTELRTDAERYLQAHRPVRRRHGKLLEDGASGFLQKKLTIDGNKDAVTAEVDWCSLNKLFSDGATGDGASFGSKHWASVYLASTPQQAAEMGLKFPGVNEVEEIDDIDGNSSDPFVAAAIANERELDLSEEQKKNYRKVKEEDDAYVDRKLQIHLKRKRHQKRR